MPIMTLYLTVKPWTMTLWSFVLSGWERRGSEPVPRRRSLATVGVCHSRAWTSGGTELCVFDFLQHVSSAPVAGPGHGLQGEGGLLWVPLSVASGRPQGVPGGTDGPHGPGKQKVKVWCVGFSRLCSEFCSRRRFQTSSCLCLYLRMLRRTNRV